MGAVVIGEFGVRSARSDVLASVNDPTDPILALLEAALINQLVTDDERPIAERWWTDGSATWPA